MPSHIKHSGACAPHKLLLFFFQFGGGTISAIAYSMMISPWFIILLPEDLVAFHCGNRNFMPFDIWLILAVFLPSYFVHHSLLYLV